MSDPFDLQRFVDAQAQTYEHALSELRQGQKRTHWMWFVFPQIEGLGRSGMAQRFAIRDLEEARAYLAHPILGRRLVESATALTTLDTDDPAVIFGAVDAQKLHSSMTLFALADPVAVFGSVDAQKLRSSMTLVAAAAPDEPVFREVLDHWFDGVEDDATLSRL